MKTRFLFTIFVTVISLWGCGGSSQNDPLNTESETNTDTFHNQIFGTWYWKSRCLDLEEGGSQKVTLVINANNATTDTKLYGAQGCDEETLSYHARRVDSYQIGNPYTSPSGIEGYEADYEVLSFKLLTGTLDAPPPQGKFYNIIALKDQNLLTGLIDPSGVSETPSGRTPSERAKEFDLDNGVWVR